MLFVQVLLQIKQALQLKLVPVQHLTLIPRLHDTLLDSTGHKPKLAILLQHYRSPLPNHSLIKVVGHKTRD